MSLKRKIGKAGAAATLGLGLMAAAPLTVFAHGHDQVKVDEHVDIHIDKHVNIDQNGAHVDIHSNKHVNIHNDSHVNEHINEHSNEHVNKHTNEHVNAHTNVHVNIHSKGNGGVDENIHLNIHGTGAAAQLESALQSLHCDQVDYLYAYLQSQPCTDKEIEQIHVNVNEMEHLCATAHGNAQLSITQKQEAWRLLIKTMNVAHLQVACVDNDQHPIDLFTYTGPATLNLQLKDKSGTVLATIHTPSGSVTPAMFVHDVTSTVHAAQAARKLSNGGHFVPAPVGELPKTATNDPLMLLLAALLILFGGLAFGLAVHWTKDEKKQ